MRIQPTSLPDKDTYTFNLKSTALNKLADLAFKYNNLNERHHTICTEWGSNNDLINTLFFTIYKNYSFIDNITKIFRVRYRNHIDINSEISRLLYDNKLTLELIINPNNHVKIPKIHIEQGYYRAMPQAEQLFKKEEDQKIKIGTVTNRHLLIVSNKEITLLTLLKLIKIWIKLLTDEGIITATEKYVDMFLDGFIEEDIDKVTEAANNLYDEKEIKRAQMEPLKSLFKTSKETILNKLDSKLQEANEKTEIYLNNWTNWNTILEELKIKKRALILADDDNEINPEQILDHLSKNPYITSITHYEDDKILINYTAPLLYYDEEIIKRYKKTTDSTWDKKFYDIFLNKKYLLYTESAIILNLSSFKTDVFRLSITDFMGHPHINRYGCQGNHPDEIRNWLETRDYIGCIEQISYMVLNLNFADSIVINELKYYLQSNPSKKTFIEKETGRRLSMHNILEKEVTNEDTEIDRC